MTLQKINDSLRSLVWLDCCNALFT